MPTDRSMLITLIGSVAGGAVAFFALAWPHYRGAATFANEVARLEERIAASAEQQVSLQTLQQDLNHARLTYETSLRQIPPIPDMAGLMRVLTVPVDEERVLDQTFTAGRASTDPTVSDGSIGVLPLTVDMTARFDALYDVVRTAEEMQRLVRVASIRMERSPKWPDLVAATIGLEAIYETQGDAGASDASRATPSEVK